MGQLGVDADADAGASADGVSDGVSLGVGVPAGVAVWPGVWVVSLGDGRAVREGLGARDGVGECVGMWVGIRVGVDGGVLAGVEGAGFVLPAGRTDPVDTGRTSTYSTSTPRNAPMSAMVEVRGRLLMRRSRSPGRYRVRPTR